MGLEIKSSSSLMLSFKVFTIYHITMCLHTLLYFHTCILAYLHNCILVYLHTFILAYLNRNFLSTHLVKGAKIRLIIFAEFSARGYPPPSPSRKMINFFRDILDVAMGEPGRGGGSFLCLYFFTCFRAF